MSGRPINKDRELSIFLGEKTYQGSAHSRCGTTERYVKHQSCVYCARIIATEQREARKYLQRHVELRAGADVEAMMLDKAEPMVLEESDDAEERRRQAIEDLM
jgi:hypothetical protein